MGALFSLAVFLLLLPIVIIAAVGVGCAAWMRRGSLDALYAAWRVLLYSYDRWLCTHFNSERLARFINRIESARMFHASVTRHIAPRWFGRRVYDTYSDPVAGPVTALVTGAIVLRFLSHLVIDVGRIPQWIDARIGTQGVTAAVAWLASIRSDRDVSGWWWTIVFAAMVSLLADRLRDRSVLRSCEGSYKAILKELEAGKAGIIELTSHRVPPEWISGDAFDTPEARTIFRVLFASRYAAEPFRPPRRLPNLPLAPPPRLNVEVLSFSLMPGAAEGKRLPLAASYSLVNPLGVQVVVLDRPVVPGNLWTKFLLLHEVGHLRAAGPGALLVQKGGVELILFASLAVAALGTPPRLGASLSWPLASVPLLYLTWRFGKWILWDRDGYPELCADLFACGQLKPTELAEALRKRRRTLDHIFRAPPPVPAAARNRGSRALHLVHRLVALERRAALTWVQLRCGLRPEGWSRFAEHPPFQFRIVTLAFSAWCLLVAFAAVPKWHAAVAAWLLTVVCEIANRQAFGRVADLDRAFSTFYPSEAP